jgi:nitrogen fixation/metabolism regulation signal transduction histidine kinase
MLLTLFSALALAFVLSEKLSAPLSALAEATRAIAKGDYTEAESGERARTSSACSRSRSTR